MLNVVLFVSYDLDYDGSLLLTQNHQQLAFSAHPVAVGEARADVLLVHFAWRVNEYANAEVSDIDVVDWQDDESPVHLRVTFSRRPVLDAGVVL